jgi:hypothetical protein
MYMLENILSEYNLTHEQAAEIIGVSNWGLKKLLSGKDELNALQAIKLQDRINLSGNKVTLDQLFRKGDLSGRVADWIIKVWLDGGPSNREYFEQIAGAEMAESDKEIKSLIESYIEAESEPGIIRDILKAGAATINYRRVTIALQRALL